MIRIRSAAVSGLFYPEDSRALAETVSRLMWEAGVYTNPTPKALIVPHAGYIYSGAVAASAYRTINGNKKISRVVLMGPAHRIPVDGLVEPDADAFATPLGVVPLDREGLEAALSLPQVTINSAAHMLEHSLEVHLPFLQTALDNFTLVPLAIGEVTTPQVAEVLDRLWGGEETLIVISSDLSHYLPYDAARKSDTRTARAIVDLRPDLIRHDGACGAAPVRGLLTVARQRGMKAELLDLRNSGDTEGDQDRVVGYGAFAFSEQKEAAPAGRSAP